MSWCRNDTDNLRWSESFFLYYEKYKEEVSFQTMVVGVLVLVLTNDNKTLIFKCFRCRIWIYVSVAGTGDLGHPTANLVH